MNSNFASYPSSSTSNNMYMKQNSHFKPYQRMNSVKPINAIPAGYPQLIPRFTQPQTSIDELLMSGSTTSKRRTRTVFNPSAVTFLEKEFFKNAYPDYEVRAQYGRLLGVTEDRIQVWFQNKRSRSKKSKSANKPSTKASTPASTNETPTTSAQPTSQTSITTANQEPASLFHQPPLSISTPQLKPAFSHCQEWVNAINTTNIQSSTTLPQLRDTITPQMNSQNGPSAATPDSIGQSLASSTYKALTGTNMTPPTDGYSTPSARNTPIMNNMDTTPNLTYYNQQHCKDSNQSPALAPLTQNAMNSTADSYNTSSRNELKSRSDNSLSDVFTPSPAPPNQHSENQQNEDSTKKSELHAPSLDAVSKKRKPSSLRLDSLELPLSTPCPSALFNGFSPLWNVPFSPLYLSSNQFNFNQYKSTNQSQLYNQQANQNAIQK